MLTVEDGNRGYRRVGVYCRPVVQMWRAVCLIRLRYRRGFVKAAAVSLESLRDRECQWVEGVGVGRSFVGYDLGNQAPTRFVGAPGCRLSLVEECLKPPGGTLVILTGTWLKLKSSRQKKRKREREKGLQTQNAKNSCGRGGSEQQLNREAP